MIVFKGNAYGYGAVEIAKQVVAYRVDKITIALVDEVVELRKSNIKLPILVLDYISDSQVSAVVDNDWTITLYLKGK